MGISGIPRYRLNETKRIFTVEGRTSSVSLTEHETTLLNMFITNAHIELGVRAILQQLQTGDASTISRTINSLWNKLGWLGARAWLKRVHQDRYAWSPGMLREPALSTNLLRAGDFAWSEEATVQLRSLWVEGHSTAEIGRRLGVSKHAVVGKAHRLDLPARPSPIRRDPNAAPRQPAPRCVPISTLPPLSTEQVAPSTTSPVPSEISNGSAVEELGEVKPSTVVAQPSPVLRAADTNVASRTYARRVECCWPIGEPSTPTFRFCNAEAVRDKPYCGDHVQRAYIPTRPLRINL